MEKIILILSLYNNLTKYIEKTIALKAKKMRKGKA